MKQKARAFAYGDNIDTDRIIPGKYTKTLDRQSWVEHVLEDLDPTFRMRVREGDAIAAGNNFGCGSSREQAPIALKLAGVSCVIARYFARIFYRNAINIGLPLLEIPNHDIREGDELEIDLSTGVVLNLTRNQTYTAKPMPDVMIRILREGGLVPFLRKYGDYD